VTVGTATDIGKQKQILQRLLPRQAEISTNFGKLQHTK